MPHKKAQILNAENAGNMLSDAIQANRVKMVKWILDHTCLTNLEKYLIQAVTVGNVEIVKLLHANGADIYARHNCAIMTACYQGHLEVVQFLHAAGVHYSDQSVIGACLKGHVAVVRYLHLNSAGACVDYNAIIAKICSDGHLAMMEYLYEDGYAKIQASGTAAIRTAARKGRLDVVKFLHGQGVDLDAINPFQADSKVKSYIQAKKWLQQDVSYLKRRAAESFVCHHDTMPDSDLIPSDVMSVLVAARM